MLSDIGCSIENVEKNQFTTGFMGSGVSNWAIHCKEEIDIHEPLCLNENIEIALVLLSNSFIQSLQRKLTIISLLVCT